MISEILCLWNLISLRWDTTERALIEQGEFLITFAKKSGSFNTYIISNLVLSGQIIVESSNLMFYMIINVWKQIFCTIFYVIRQLFGSFNSNLIRWTLKFIRFSFAKGVKILRSQILTEKELEISDPDWFISALV